MSWETDLLGGLCAHLAGVEELDHDEDISFEWSPEGVYPAPEDGLPVAQFLYAYPPEPDVCVSWSVMPLTAAHPVMATRLVSITATIRGTRDPRVAPRVADAIFLNLHGLERAVWGGVPVTLVWHQAASPLGSDGNNRVEHSSTFHAWVAWPSLHTTE